MSQFSYAAKGGGPVWEFLYMNAFWGATAGGVWECTGNGKGEPREGGGGRGDFGYAPVGFAFSFLSSSSFCFFPPPLRKGKILQQKWYILNKRWENFLFPVFSLPEPGSPCRTKIPFY